MIHTKVGYGKVRRYISVAGRKLGPSFQFKIPQKRRAAQLKMTLPWSRVICFKALTLLKRLIVLSHTMEPLTSMRAPTPSYDPQTSKKRTSSPDAPTTRTKKPKTDPGQGHSDKDRRRRRRRKQKKQPIARDSGDHDSGAVSGNTQSVPSSSLTPASPVPSASRSTETQQSPASSQSDRPDRPFDSSSAPPPPLHSSLGSSSHEQPAACAPPFQRECVMPASHSECKVRLLSVSVSN